MGHELKITMYIIHYILYCAEHADTQRREAEARTRHELKIAADHSAQGATHTKTRACARARVCVCARAHTHTKHARRRQGRQGFSP